MINFNSYNSLGQSGMSLMQKAMTTAGAAAERVANSVDPMDIAETSMDMSEAKVQMAVGAYLVKSQNELMGSTLQLLAPYGVGMNYDARY